MTPQKSELNHVRDFLEQAGETIRYSPLHTLAPAEKLTLLYEILIPLADLKRALHVDVDKTILRTDTGLVNPADALEALSNLLHSTFAAYHRLGLAQSAVQGFRTAHVEKLSKLGPIDQDTLDFFNVSLPPNYHKILTKQTPTIIFVDPEQEPSDIL